MRLQLVSDIHIEFHKDCGLAWAKSLPVCADILVVAGDLGPATMVTPVLQILCDRFKDVVYVAGNHEFYSGSFESVRVIRAGLQIANLHWLDNSVVTLQGQRFVGSTMWFRFVDYLMMHRKKLNDFKQIKLFDSKVREEIRAATIFLNQNVSAGDVVVTHHLPSWSVVPEQYLHDIVSGFYVSDKDHFFGKPDSPAAWLHGHSHPACAKYLGDTLVCRNPHGYHGYDHGNTGYNPNLVIDVTDGKAQVV